MKKKKREMNNNKVCWPDWLDPVSVDYELYAMNV